MELRELKLQVVHRVPENLHQSILYVSFDCNVVIHLCACGCGEKVVTPIAPNFWAVKYNGETVSLSPSIGNFQFSCKSHYWIRENKVVWVPEATMTSKRKNEKNKKKRWKDRLKILF